MRICRRFFVRVRLLPLARRASTVVRLVVGERLRRLSTRWCKVRSRAVVMGSLLHRVCMTPMRPTRCWRLSVRALAFRVPRSFIMTLTLRSAALICGRLRTTRAISLAPTVLRRLTARLRIGPKTRLVLPLSLDVLYRPLARTLFRGTKDLCVLKNTRTMNRRWLLLTWYRAARRSLKLRLALRLKTALTLL